MWPTGVTLAYTPVIPGALTHCWQAPTRALTSTLDWMLILGDLAYPDLIQLITDIALDLVLGLLLNCSDPFPWMLGTKTQNCSGGEGAALRVGRQAVNLTTSLSWGHRGQAEQ